jgi:hypothetical protein
VAGVIVQAVSVGSSRRLTDIFAILFVSGRGSRIEAVTVREAAAADDDSLSWH